MDPPPVPLTGLVGREREVAELIRQVREQRLVTVTGPGGCGKTRLAIAVATTPAALPPDGACWVGLAPLRDPGLVPQAVAAALGVREQVGAGPATALGARLREEELLLVLDNCEHLLDACAELVASLLGACPGLRVLATSRQRLGLTGEVTRAAPPLSVPDPGQLPPTASLPRYESVQLFVERAAAVDPGFALTADTAEPVARICHRLDGIPLALELAAARLRVLPAAAIADRLATSYAVLTGGSRTALPQQRTLHAAMDWSHELLDDPARTLLRRLSVFAGGFVLDAAEAVCSDAALPRDAVLDVLTSLVDQSLVLVDGGPAPRRYRLLETVRQYAAQRLREAGEDVAVRDRLVAWVGALAEEAEPGLATADPATLRAIAKEHDNLRAGLAAATGAAFTRIAGAAAQFWWFGGHLTEGRARLEEAITGEAAEDVSPRTGRVLAAAGLMAWAQGEPDAAVAHLHRAVALWRAAGDAAQLAQSLRYLSAVCEFRGDLDRALSLVEESVTLYRTTDDGFGLAMSLGRLGITAVSRRDHATAETAFAEGVRLCRAIGADWALAMTLRHRGIGALRQRRPLAARADLSEALQLMRALDDRMLVTQCLETYAAATAACGEHERAALLLGAVEAQRATAGMTVIYRDDLARGAQTARAALGDERFAATVARGRRLREAEALDLALAPPEADPALPAGLTRREAEILNEVAGGRTNAEVAAALHLSSRTVDWHLTAIYQKLGVRSRTQAARWAHEHGLAAAPTGSGDR